VIFVLPYTHGRRAFSVAAPLLWNSLPQHGPLGKGTLEMLLLLLLLLICICQKQNLKPHTKYA